MAITTKNLKELQSGLLFLFPAQLALSAVEKDNGPTLANIYQVLVNHDSVVIYAKPGFPDVHYMGHHECPEVQLFSLNGNPCVPGLDLIDADALGLLRERLAFHGYYRDFFARTFNQLPPDDYLAKEGMGEKAIQILGMKSHCQTLCQYHLWRYNQIKARLDGIAQNGGYEAELKQIL
jgi:hypothetical protein